MQKGFVRRGSDFLFHLATDIAGNRREGKIAGELLQDLAEKAGRISSLHFYPDWDHQLKEKKKGEGNKKNSSAASSLILLCP